MKMHQTHRTRNTPSCSAVYNERPRHTQLSGKAHTAHDVNPMLMHKNAHIQRQLKLNCTSVVLLYDITQVLTNKSVIVTLATNNKLEPDLQPDLSANSRQGKMCF